MEVDPTYSVTSFETGGGNSSLGDSQNMSQTISIGESHTTIPTMNGSSAKFIEQERERRKVREVEREKERKKIDAIQEKLQYHAGGKTNGVEAIGEGWEEDHQPQGVTEIVGHSNLDGKSPRRGRKREKKEKKKKREKKDRDKHHRDSSGTRKHSSRKESSKKMNAGELDAVNQETRQQPQDQEAQDELRPLHGMVGRSIPNQKEELRDTFSGFVQPARDSSYLPLNLNAPTSTNTPGSSKANLFGNSSPKQSPEISSQISMDYSMDTASLLGDGSLLGGQFAGDGSVITLGTAASENRSLLSCVTRSTVHEASPASGWNRNNASAPISESDADDISLSLLASSSSGMDQIIPTDEELFVIGWAKAMDQNSGSYYYFTLDRTKTVWDNPLLNSSG